MSDDQWHARWIEIDTPAPEGKASSRPWRVIARKDLRPRGPLMVDMGAVECIGDAADANAALIVRAVNAHDALVEAAKAALVHLTYSNGDPITDGAARVVNDLRSAIAAAAEGETT